MSLETEIKTLAAAVAGHTAALADLAAAVRAVATGRSLNAAAAADQAPAPVVMPATTAAPAEEQTAPVMPAAPKAVAPAVEPAPAGMLEPARVEAEAPRSEPAAETAAPTDRAAAELATPTAFMERIRELTQGVPSARDVLAAVLKAHGWSSFRTLDRSEYQTALDGIAAELAGERA